ILLARRFSSLLIVIMRPTPLQVKPAENAVAELLVRGMTPDECALHLGVSIATIRTHLSALYRKTHTRNQAELLLIIRAIHG
ncbi:LuxR C-terminal-related transcriptional regulator, partial [Klebsiella quasipneumoniae]|uniref:LuxR C-terminal-related transcriptional regulator n=1 Tax=Klebsiella quasipneumoniae TaxID=1463165 RepID=UPI0010F12E63